MEDYAEDTEYGTGGGVPPLFDDEFNVLARMFDYVNRHHGAHAKIAGVGFYAPTPFRTPTYFLKRNGGIWTVVFLPQSRSQMKRTTISSIVERRGNQEIYQRDLLFSKLFVPDDA